MVAPSLFTIGDKVNSRGILVSDGYDRSPFQSFIEFPCSDFLFQFVEGHPDLQPP